MSEYGFRRTVSSDSTSSQDSSYGVGVLEVPICAGNSVLYGVTSTGQSLFLNPSYQYTSSVNRTIKPQREKTFEEKYCRHG